jgi:hypothetical protein
MKYLFTVAATLVAAQDGTTRVKDKFIDLPYDIGMSCGNCIASGFNYVWKTKETGLVVNDEEYPVNTGAFSTTDVMCCEGSKDFYADYAWAGQTVRPYVDDGNAATSCALLF